MQFPGVIIFLIISGSPFLGQVLRLRLPAEVKVSESKCQRAKVNGALLIIMPKLDAKANAISLRGDQRAAQRAATATSASGGGAGGAASQGPARSIASQQRAASTTISQPQRTVLKPKKLSLQEQMMQEAMQSAGGNALSTGGADARRNSLLDASIGAASRAGVNVANIVPRKEDKSNAQADVVEETVFKMSSRVVELD